MDVTRKHISRILDLRKMLQTGFSLVSAAVVCSILENILGVERSSLTTEYLTSTAHITHPNRLRCFHRNEYTVPDFWDLPKHSAIIQLEEWAKFCK